MPCDSSKDFSIKSEHRAVLRFAGAKCVVKYRLKDGLRIRRRAGNHPQNFACRRLLLSSLGALSLGGFKLFGEPLYFFFELAVFASARTLFLLCDPKSSHVGSS